MTEIQLQNLRKEAVELIRKGGLSAKIGLAFLKTQARA